MLRIVLCPETEGLEVLRVEGAIRSPWVAVLAEECRGRLSRPGVELALDLEHVSYIDLHGRSLLRSLSQQGVRLRNVSPLLEAMLQEDAVP